MKGRTLFSRRWKTRIGSAAALAATALAVTAGSASAGVLVDSAPSCDDQSLSRPFAPWLDLMQYTPLPGGDFESAASGWSLSGGASVVGGNESFHVGGDDDASSLRVPAGGSATSPTICVGLEHPTVRFFAKRNSGGLLGLSTMRVEVLYENNLGIVERLPIGVVTPTSSWQPTLPMPVVANLLALLPGEHTPVAFRFTPLSGGDWSLDDIQVDPYGRRY